MCAALRRDGGGGGGGHQGNRGWPVAPCRCWFPKAGRRRWSPGKLRHFRRVAACALGGRPGQPFREKIPAEVVRLSPRAAPDLIWVRCNSLHLKRQATLWRPASLTVPAPPATPAPNREVAEAGARGGQEQVGVRPGRPHRSPGSF